MFLSKGLLWFIVDFHPYGWKLAAGMTWATGISLHSIPVIFRLCSPAGISTLPSNINNRL
ncbi:hypothetical protein [Salimicrobium flavidum]|uniref:Uncharacterized protein n=1 Tax=Salimicrobium flavidum TaxID=570947 RepID=A0A1N7J8R3_9BACI|nr:hypothetical protein [Salimicrobium flavidum]SIS45748.1 hypothetical protein SAMN05421687_104161 [Salimicrobium flavidum]